MIGKQLSHFRIIEKIGEGGMGVVYRAEDSKLGRHVALKVMRPEFVASEDRRQRFIREARTAASVTHPNIVTVHEIDEADGVTFIAMELLEGKGLSAHIGGRPLLADEAIRVALDVAEGLARAHSSGVIHRDLKPDNVVIGRGGQVTVLDFGLAKLHDDAPAVESDGSDIQTVSLNATQDGRILGTAAYMSPEQARGLPVDSRSDVFSFGVLLYEMVTGRTPFVGPTITDTLTAILRDRQAPIASLNPDVPAELERILNRCLEKNPEDRYQDTEHLVEDLRALKRVTDSNSQPLPKVSLSGDTFGTVTPVWLQPRFLVPSIVAIAVLAAAMVLPRWLSKPAAPADRTSVAVLPFTNMQDGDDADRFGQILQELIITDLSGMSTMNVYSSQRLFDIQKQLGRLDTRTIDRDMASQVAREAGAGTMLTGSVSQIGDRWILTSQLVDVEQGTVMGSERIDGADLYVMVDDLTKRIRENLGHDINLAGAGDLAVRDRTSASIEAYQIYLRGNELLEDLEFGAAVEAFNEAVAVDPDFGQASYKLAIANWWNRGIENKHPSADGTPPAEILETLLSGDLKLSEKDRMLARAVLPLVEHRYADAKKLYEELVQRYPDEKEAWYGLGEALRHAPDGGPDLKTLRAFEKAIDLDPGFRLAYYHAAEIYEMKGMYDEGIARLKQLVDLYPDDPVWRAHYAKLIVLRGDPAEVEAVIDESLERSPNPEEKHRLLEMLAEARFSRGKLQEGMELIERGIAIDSDEPPKHLQALLATANRYRQKHGDAEDIFKKLLEADPTNRDAILGLYTVYDEQRRYGEASKLIQNAISTKPQSTYFGRWIDLATKLGDRGQVEDAIEAGIKHHSHDGNIAQIRADLLNAAVNGYRELGDFVQSEEFARRAFGDEGKAADHARLGWTLLRLGRYDEARASFDDGLELDAENIEARHGLVRLGLLEKDYDPAVANGEMCARSGKGRGQFALLEAYVFSGRLEEAEALAGHVLHDIKDVGERLETMQGVIEIFIVAGEYDLALQWTDKVSTMLPGLPIPRLAGLRVWALLKLDRIDEAKKALHEALSTSPRHWMLNLEDAGLHLTGDDPAAAEWIARELVTKGPAYSEAFVQLATALAQQGRHDEALKFARRRVEMSPDRSGNTLLAWVLIDGELDLDEGIRIAKQAREFPESLGEPATTFPYHASPEHCLGLAYLKKGDAIKAAEFLRKAAKQRPDRPLIGEHLRQAGATRASWAP